jgi:hypothetical protein
LSIIESFATIPTSQSLAAASSTRKYLFIQNISSAPIHVNFGTFASTTSPRLDPGASFTFEGTFIPQNAVWVQGTAENQRFCILYNQ